jgi:hypothetical protein
MDKRDAALNRKLEAIYADRKQGEMEKMAAAFEAMTAAFIAQSKRELELARALGDEDTAVKEYIKAGVMAQARVIFAEQYARVSGRREVLWDE